ncbi:3-isopropylmalate dehydrogenase [Sphingosinicella rhizophila]|uniref:3-isopropylmalate dehydrogenase n=1 Tax=Sphingosinicella rhizophila TaxID=3050082 RepID=A0ABU3QAW2_9SPHN|nr:3-isopropylmalate dehydrogenase [Sphingosinicella sp. GR2756]MDT9600545.1 3-isopropylmalate dehydrogenase [Sphingosinicella sp. GR2756]
MSRMLLLPGDGIGPEVLAQAERVIEALNRDFGLDVEVQSALLGGASIDTYGTPLTAETLAQAKASDVILMGSVGGPKWSDTPFDRRPEQGLLDLRKGLSLFANLRPAKCFAALTDSSTLKPEVVAGLDLVFVRELIGGVYFGEPRGIEALADGGRRGFNTQSYTDEEVRRVARTAFELARTRSSRLCSVDKSNVMEAGLLWREEVTMLGASDYPDVDLSHMYADNCAMQLVREPRQFDVILTDNLFGDLLSDAAAMLTGSLGMLPSAALGESGKSSLYEPIHGSAPDIAGKDLANPCATILSLAMALRHGLERPDLAERVESAVARALDEGYRTAELTGGSHRVGTAAMGQAIIARLHA